MIAIALLTFGWVFAYRGYQQARVIARMGESFSHGIRTSLEDCYQAQNPYPKTRTKRGRLVVVDEPPPRQVPALKRRTYRRRVGFLTWLLIDAPRRLRSR